jgi:hypothetical protein
MEGGEIPVNVEAGQAQAFMNREDGTGASLSEEARAIINKASAPHPCTDWNRSFAGPGVYWESSDGCAVVGYPGYMRYMSWENGSDMLICTQGRGWDGSTARWTGMGCSYGGNSDVQIPWGNSLAYTKAKGMSVSGVTSAVYVWR